MSSSNTIVRVQLSERSYDIEIGCGCLGEAGRFVAERRDCRHAAVITDQNLRDTHGRRVVEALSSRGIRSDLLVVPPGEPSKSIAEAERLWNRLVEVRADRKTVIVAVGGGVVGDLAGFVAATFARGLALVQIPTSLIAQVDSSVGGKVGINLPLAKNLVGAFWQPAGVLIDVGVLATLPEREFRSGLAEVVKYGVILDAAFFEYLEQNVRGILERQQSVLSYVVERCCRLKADVVEQDEREETGLRAVLNYGHTFAHAFEAVGGYGRYSHGEAVAIGMNCAAELAAALGRIDGALVRRQRELLAALGLPVRAGGLPAEPLLAAMHRDKKSLQGKLRFVLPSRLGHVELVEEVDPALVSGILSE